MRCHKECVRENDQVTVHPSGSEAWKALDDFDTDFAGDARNVRIGLVTDGFLPYNTSVASYSCWSIFAISYNIPPSLCMKYENMFLCLIIPGPDHLGTHLNVMLKTLIEELKLLWEGFKAHDYDHKRKFNLRAYLWLIPDFMAYIIFSGWSCNRILICPICLKDTTSLCLKFGGRSLTFIVIYVFYPWITHLG
jgi:hypothetical protein